MRKLIVLSIILFAYSTNYAQFGVKGGLNFNSNGDLTEILSETESAIKNSNTKTGYHLGVFYQSKGASFYVRPELIYTKTKSDYNGDNFDMSKLDLPVLLGFHIFKPVSVFAGPSFQYIINSDLDRVSINNIENDFTIGINIGVAIEFKKIGIDIRYEKGMTENLANFAGVENGRLDTRPNQFIVGFYLKL